MTGIDRLRELKRDKEDDTDTPQVSSGGAELGAYMQKYAEITKSLDLIDVNTKEVNSLKLKMKNAANDKARKDVMVQLQKIIDLTNKHSTTIKRQLEAIKAENDSTKDSSSAKSQMRTNQYQIHARKFHEVMTRYNDAAQAFKKDLKERTAREIKIVDKDLTDDEVEQIIESGKANDVIKEALISDNLRNVINVIEERHLDILKLERQVLEIHELFRDLATLVDLQQESLDVIETRINKSKEYAEKGEVELNEAEDYQKKARARKCCLIFILLSVLIVVLVPTLLKVIPNA